jgi:predicted AlkP superfamily pyrophosphatase or phosphodiesterase
VKQMCATTARRIGACLMGLFSVFAVVAMRGADQPAKRPNLVIMISVDMLSGEIMDRYGAGLPGGLGRLQKEGVFFENAFHEHAFTETGPGHSVLLSGRHPSSTGIPENQWRDRATGKMIYCVQDPNVVDFGEPTGKAGSSAVWFKGTTFGTWLKDQVPGSRVFAISGKDRASILMAGPKADGVYWFQDGFGFTTSTAYAKALPDWLAQFNRDLLNDLGRRSLVWTPIAPTDGIAYPGHWMVGKTLVVSQLPRLIQAPGLAMEAKGGYLLHETQDGSFWRRWRGSPFFDDTTFDAAEALIRNEHLGEDHTDLLALGLSATNVIEHAFGNSGPELLDQIRRLDRRLGVFLDRVQSGGRNVEIVFSADHGGLDFVERLQDQGIPAKRLDSDAWLRDLQSKVRKELHLDRDLLLAGNDHFPNELYFDPETARQLEDRKEWVAKVVKIVRLMPDIAAVASFDELAALPDKRFDDPREESLLYRLKYSAAPDRAGEILFAFQPMIELGAPPDHDPAQHGTAYDYDRRVPIIFWGPWRGERRLEPASTVDIAPTLAKEVGIEPAERLDGIALHLTRRE